MQILRQLYKGKLIPLETYRSVSTEYENKREEMIVEERAFIDKLNDDDLKRTFIRIVDERTGLIPEDCEQVFIQGMRLGAHLVLELTGWYQMEL